MKRTRNKVPAALPRPKRKDFAADEAGGNAWAKAHWAWHDDAAARCRANRQLRRIHALLAEVTKLSKAWLEEHSLGCAGCPFCAHKTLKTADAGSSIDTVTFDVAAINRAAHAGCVALDPTNGCGSLYTPEEKAGVHAEPQDVGIP